MPGPASLERPINNLSMIFCTLALTAIKYGLCLPAVFHTLPSAGFPLSAGQLRTTGQQLPTRPGHGGHWERCLDVCGSDACHSLHLRSEAAASAHQLPLPASKEAPLAGTARAAPGCWGRRGASKGTHTPKHLKWRGQPGGASPPISWHFMCTVRPVIPHTSPVRQPNCSNAVDTFSKLPPNVASSPLCPHMSRSQVSPCSSSCPAVWVQLLHHVRWPDAALGGQPWGWRVLCQVKPHWTYREEALCSLPAHQKSVLALYCFSLVLISCYHAAPQHGT